MLALELHICPNNGDQVGRLCNFCSAADVWKKKRIGSEKWEVGGPAPVYLGATYRGKAAQCREARTWRLRLFTVLCAVQSTLHAQCTWATLSAAAMWLLHCCSNKGKRSLGVVCACTIKRHTRICSKAAIWQAPLKEALVRLRLSACVFSIWSWSLISLRRIIFWKETTREIVFCWTAFGGSWSLGFLFLSFRNLRCTEGWGKVEQLFSGTCYGSVTYLTVSGSGILSSEARQEVSKLSIVN